MSKFIKFQAGKLDKPDKLDIYQQKKITQLEAHKNITYHNKANVFNYVNFV